MHIDRNDTKKLKQFAITMSWAFPVVFSGILPWLFDYSIHYWPFAISAILVLLWLLKAQWIYYPKKVWMTIAGVIGWINTRIILGACFYLLFVPVGQLMKRLGKLDYQDKINKNKRSNYHMSQVKSDHKDLENPF